SLINFVELPTALEQEIAAVFQLVNRNRHSESPNVSADRSSVQNRGRPNTPSDPPPAPSVPDPGTVQPLRQPTEAGQVRTAHTTVALLNPGDGLFLGLTLHPFMPIERNLQAKGRVPAHLNSEMSPPRVENMKMVVIDQRPVFGPTQHHFASVIVFRLPDQGRSF